MHLYIIGSKIRVINFEGRHYLYFHQVEIARTISVLYVVV
jgi:hypothetical protein